MRRFRQFLVAQYHRLMQIRDTPHAIAGGAAIGLLLGFTPLLGFKTLLAVLVAWLCRCSKLSAALAVSFHDLLLPIWPVVMRWQYQIGYYLLHRPHHLPPKIKTYHYEELLRWKSLGLLWPVLVGSIVLAIPLAVAAYFIILYVVAQYRKGKEEQITYS